MPIRSLHPTAVALVQTVEKLLDETSISNIHSEKVLEISGISKGSLYHHFEDFQELIEISLLYRYSKWIDATIDAMAKLLYSARTKDELRLALFDVTARTQRDSLRSVRIERARIFAEADRNPRLAARLTKESERMTSSIEDLIREVISRGLFKDGLSPRAVAVFIQAYSTGYIINDFTENKLAEKEWVNLINSIIDQMFIGN
jgi:AcrR family transcriptional regulator